MTDLINALIVGVVVNVICYYIYKWLDKDK